MDDLRIDSHKLMFHVERLSDWLRGRRVYPIYIDVGVYSGCNYRCRFCAYDYTGYPPRALDPGCFRRFVRCAGSRGVKSLMFAGDGEPLLHPDICTMVKDTDAAGVDAAMTTNAVLLTPEVSRRILPYLSWLRASIDAGTSRTFAFLHRAPREDFKKVMENLRQAVRIRARQGSNCTIGGQCILLPENRREVFRLARQLKDIGADYLILKPYSAHPLSINRLSRAGASVPAQDLASRARRFSSDTFQVVVREQAFSRLTAARRYRKCLGLPIITPVTASGDVYPCSMFVGKQAFSFGNICRQRFDAIWESSRRRRITKYLFNHFEVNRCRQACRLDEINAFLWELKHPGPHVNFI